MCPRQDRDNVPCSVRLRLNHYRTTDFKVGNRGPTPSRRIHLTGGGETREISFIVSPYLLTRVAYECKFASLRYRRCDANRISSRPSGGWNAPIKTAEQPISRAREKCKRRTRVEALGAFVLLTCTGVQIDNAKTRTRIFGLYMRFVSYRVTGSDL